MKAQKLYKLHKVKELNDDESLELFSWHAFRQNHPIEGYEEHSKRVVSYCSGLPLALQVLGSSLFQRNLDVWESALKKLKATPDSQILTKLKISFDSLQDDHDRNLFLDVACFFVDKDKDFTITVLDGCDFYTEVGIDNLIDRCLLIIDQKNKLMMHQLLQDMAREIVRQESTEEPEKRSRLWHHKDAFNVLIEKTGTRNMEGLILDMNLLKEDKQVRTAFEVNRKRCYEEILTPLFSNLLKSPKILDLSHSHCHTKPPYFSKVPNLEWLIFKNCARNGDYGVFHANRIAMSQLLATTKEVKSWHSFIYPSLLRPRKRMETSCALLPQSVLHLSLENSNLSDDDFPMDLSNPSSLASLNLSFNAICSLPICIKNHTGLQILHLISCTKLRTLEVQHKLKLLHFGGCTLLEKVTFQSLPLTMEEMNLYGNQFYTCRLLPVIHNDKHHSLVEITGDFKFQPLENIDMEIIQNLDLSNIGSMGCSNVMLSCYGSHKARKFPLQVSLYAYFLESKVLDWFNLKNVESSTFSVPSHLNFRIRCLSVCSIYALSNNQKKDYRFNCGTHTIIRNTTKSLIWSHSPNIFGIPEVDEDMMMLSYWKFENQLDGGDELHISVVGNEAFQVKEVGVHLVCKEQEEKNSQTTSEDASQLQFSLWKCCS
ncbi:hypothetical protein ACSBR1_004117 [Camellia fascicularis]